MKKTKPSIIGFIFSILLVIILIIYSIKEISDFIWFIILSVKITDTDTAYNIVYFGIIDSTIGEQRRALIMNEFFPKIVSVSLVLIFVTIYLGDTISYFKKLKFINLKINSNEFNTCSSCNHDQVHFHAISCPKCGSPEVNMYIKEMKRNLGGNIALLAVIIISTSGYLL